MASQPGSTLPTAVSVAPPLLPPPPPPPAGSMQKVAMPLHVQKLQGALCLDRLIDQVEHVYKDSLSWRKERSVEMLKWVIVLGTLFVLAITGNNWRV